MFKKHIFYIKKSIQKNYNNKNKNLKNMETNFTNQTTLLVIIFCLIKHTTGNHIVNYE